MSRDLRTRKSTDLFRRMIGRKKRDRTKVQNPRGPRKVIQILFCKQMRAAFLRYYQFVYGEVTPWWGMESRWGSEKGTSGKGVHRVQRAL